MIEEHVLRALQKGARDAFDASTIIAGFAGWTQKTRIKAVATTLALPTDGRYLELINIPNNRASDYWGPERVYQGNFRFLLHWNVDSAGPYGPLALLDQLGGFYSKEKLLVDGPASVQIYDFPSASGVIESGSELLFPLNLPYRCFRP